MGQNQSAVSRGHCTFSLKSHSNDCAVKKAVESQDFVQFQRELKNILQFIGPGEGHSKVFANYVASITSSSWDTGTLCDNIRLYAFNRRQSDPNCSLDRQRMNHRILIAKVGVKKRIKTMLYMPCECPGRYAGIDLDSFDNTGRTALNVAIRKGDGVIVSLYLYCGADPNKYNKNGDSPLHVASAAGSARIVDMLLDAGAESNATDQPNPQLFTQRKETGVMVAASHGYAMCVNSLLKSGANPDLQDCNGNTALHKSCLYGYRACVKILLKYQANVNLRNSDRVTPLQLAFLHRNVDIARLLVNYGCDVTCYSSDLLSIMSLASMSGEVDIVKKCLKEGEKVNKLDKDNKSALYYTFTLDYPYQCRCSVSSETCRNDVNIIQYTLARFDTHSQNPNRKEITELFISSGSDVEMVLQQSLDTDLRHVLNHKHFTLPENIAIFQRIIQACGFHRISISDLEKLFWKMLSAKGRIIAKLLVFAVPRLDCRIGTKLSKAVDWTGAHTKDAIYRYLEAAGSDLEISNWIYRRTRQPRSLQEWSRDSVRRCLSSNVVYQVEDLPIPKMLKMYICLRDVLAI